MSIFVSPDTFRAGEVYLPAHNEQFYPERVDESERFFFREDLLHVVVLQGNERHQKIINTMCQLANSNPALQSLSIQFRFVWWRRYHWSIVSMPIVLLYQLAVLALDHRYQLSERPYQLPDDRSVMEFFPIYGLHFRSLSPEESLTTWTAIER